MTRLPLRMRVALAFTATTAVLLLALGAFLYVSVEHTLLDDARADLRIQLAAVAAAPPARRDPALQALPPSFGQVLSRDGRVVASTATVSGPLLGTADFPVGRGTVELNHDFQLTGQAEPEHGLFLARRVGSDVVVVGTSREDVADDLQVVLVRLLIGSAIGLVIASALGYAVAGAPLRPVERMRRRAEKISAERSDERLPVPHADDELRRLGITLNEMLDRLDAGLQRERRFVAEAGHELRTPLAMLRMELDLALSKKRTQDEFVDALRSASEEVDRLAGLAEDLLLLASTERPRPLDDVPVAELAQRVVARYALAAGPGRAVELDVSAAPVVRGDAGRLERAVRNLVDNALLHGAGDVRVGVHRDGAEALISVSDAGPGPGAAATDGDGDSGLGLRIVRATAAEHGGRVDVIIEPDGRSAVGIVLPTV